MTPEAWLEARHPGSPPTLRSAIAAALDSAVRPRETGPVRSSPASVLAEAGLSALAAAARGPADRRAAPVLLAADALLTHALEAASEEGPEALATLGAELGLDRFGALLATEST